MAIPLSGLIVSKFAILQIDLIFAVINDSKIVEVDIHLDIGIVCFIFRENAQFGASDGSKASIVRNRRKPIKSYVARHPFAKACFVGVSITGHII